jgi:hypothetical protein
MTERKVTPRQMEALESLLENGNAHMKRETFGEKTYWAHVRRAGGSMQTISDGLRAHGFAYGKIHDRELNEQFKEYGSNISAAGLRYIIDNSKYPELVKLAQERLPARVEKEAKIEAATAALEKARKESYARAAAKRRSDHLTELRKRLSKWGIHKLEWTDDELLEFARDIEGAEYHPRQ